MRYECAFAELHNPLFLAGTNFQMKLDPTKRSGLSLIFDEETKKLHVWYSGKVAILPETNVAYMHPKDSKVLGYVPEVLSIMPAPPPVMPKGPIKAQVSTPHDHVFRK